MDAALLVHRSTVTASAPRLRARVVEAKERKVTVPCTLSSGGVVTADGDVIAVRVPDEWCGK